MEDEIVMQIKLPISYFALETILSGCSEHLDQECNLMIDACDFLLTIYRVKKCHEKE